MDLQLDQMNTTTDLSLSQYFMFFSILCLHRCVNPRPYCHLHTGQHKTVLLASLCFNASLRKRLTKNTGFTIWTLDRNVVLNSTVQNALGPHGCPLACTLRQEQLELFHARPSTSTRQYHGTEFNGNTLNYMFEYLFIIYMQNFMPHVTSGFFFFFFQGKIISFYLLLLFFCIAGKKGRVSLFLSPPL